jgi:hypothetical protein
VRLWLGEAASRRADQALDAAVTTPLETTVQIAVLSAFP